MQRVQHIGPRLLPGSFSEHFKLVKVKVFAKIFFVSLHSLYSLRFSRFDST
jgi:hypothetical protein